MPVVELGYRVTDADSSQWPITNKNMNLPNHTEMFRIDDTGVNIESCAKYELLRRATVVRSVHVKLGTAVDDARMREARKVGEKPNPTKRGPSPEISKHPYFTKPLAILKALPEGYFIAQARRSQTTSSYDTYIVGRGWFEPVESFIPHLIWIDRGMPKERPCACKRCGLGNTIKIDSGSDSEDVKEIMKREDDGGTELEVVEVRVPDSMGRRITRPRRKPATPSTVSASTRASKRAARARRSPSSEASYRSLTELEPVARLSPYHTRARARVRTHSKPSSSRRGTPTLSAKPRSQREVGDNPLPRHAGESSKFYILLTPWNMLVGQRKEPIAHTPDGVEDPPSQT